jgi:hypothetical protein
MLNKKRKSSLRFILKGIEQTKTNLLLEISNLLKLIEITRGQLEQHKSSYLHGLEQLDLYKEKGQPQQISYMHDQLNNFRSHWEETYFVLHKFIEKKDFMTKNLSILNEKIDRLESEIKNIIQNEQKDLLKKTDQIIKDKFNFKKSPL